MDFTINFGAINLLVVFGATVAANVLGGIWYSPAVLGKIWREAAGPKGEVSPLIPGSSLVIPPGCAFQVRVSATEPLEVLAVTMPPWPGDEEAERVAGIWDPASASD